MFDFGKIYVGIVGMFCIINWYVDVSMRFSEVFCIYENILKQMLFGGIWVNFLKTKYIYSVFVMFISNQRLICSFSNKGVK